jgi:hypothetical protein
MIGRIRGSVLRSSWIQKTFSAAIYVGCCSVCLCECVPPCEAKRINYVKLSIVLWYSCMTLCIAEIWVNWRNVSSLYTSFLWISLRGNQGHFTHIYGVELQAAGMSRQGRNTEGARLWLSRRVVCCVGMLEGLDRLFWRLVPKKRSHPELHPRWPWAVRGYKQQLNDDVWVPASD